MNAFRKGNIKITDLENIKEVEGKLIVKYLLEDGTYYVAVIPNELSEIQQKKIEKYLNNPEQVFEIENCSGQIFHGQKEWEPINSVSMSRFYDKFLEFLESMYLEIEYSRAIAYNNLKGNSETQEEFNEQIRYVEELEELTSKMLQTNADLIAPIWRREKNILNIDYRGGNIDSVFDWRSFDHENQRLSASTSIKHDLASGFCTLCNTSVNQMNSMGNLICDLYGEKIEDAYNEEVHDNTKAK